MAAAIEMLSSARRHASLGAYGAAYAAYNKVLATLLQVPGQKARESEASVKQERELVKELNDAWGALAKVDICRAPNDPEPSATDNNDVDPAVFAPPPGAAPQPPRQTRPARQSRALANSRDGADDSGVISAGGTPLSERAPPLHSRAEHGARAPAASPSSATGRAWRRHETAPSQGATHAARPSPPHAASHASGSVRSSSTGARRQPNAPAARSSGSQSQGLSGRRNYRKPWTENVPPEKPVEKPEKSAYLMHLYPDRNGVGPDTELVEQLESECLVLTNSTSWGDVAGLSDAKQVIKEAVVAPLKYPKFFSGNRRPWRGVLLYGPPGTGKTMLAKAVAAQCDTAFLNVSAATLGSKWRGESEKLVRHLYGIARFYAPTVIFIDEIDALGSQRGGPGEHESSRKVKAELLTGMDGVSTVAGASSGDGDAAEASPKLVMTMGATNHPWDLDDALRRRLEKRIYIPLPDEETRKALFELGLAKGIPVAEDVSLPDLVRRTAGYSGADISNVVREASLMPFRENWIKLEELEQEAIAAGKSHEQAKAESEEALSQIPVKMSDLVQAVDTIRPSVSAADLENFANWQKEFGTGAQA